VKKLSFQRGVGEKNKAARWTNGIVPYTIKPGDFSKDRSVFNFFSRTFFSSADAGEQVVIVQAMRRLEQTVAINNKLCVQFRPKISTDKHFITIKNGAGCTSSVNK